jgi:hypothetical protein
MYHSSLTERENAVGIQLLNDVKKTHPTITKAWVDTGFKMPQ